MLAILVNTVCPNRLVWRSLPAETRASLVSVGSLSIACASDANMIVSVVRVNLHGGHYRSSVPAVWPV